MQKYKNLVLLLAVLLIVVAGGAAWYKKYNDGNTHEKVKNSQVDLSKAVGKEKIPLGLPEDLPVQLGNVEQSSTIDYPERGVKVSTITFLTYQPYAELVNTFESYMKQNGYNYSDEGSNDRQNSLYGIKDTNFLTVVITSDPENTQRRVQITYTYKK